MPSTTPAGSSSLLNLSLADHAARLHASPSLDDLAILLPTLAACPDYYTPSAPSAKVTAILVNETLPTLWPVICKDQGYIRIKHDYITCLRTVAGVNCLLARTSALLAHLRQQSTGELKGDASVEGIVIASVLDVLSCVLADGEQRVHTNGDQNPGLHKQTNNHVSDKQTQIVPEDSQTLHIIAQQILANAVTTTKNRNLDTRSQQWQAFTQTLTSGRLVGFAHEAQTLLHAASAHGAVIGTISWTWMGDAKAYAGWLVTSWTMAVKIAGRDRTVHSTMLVEMYARLLERILHLADADDYMTQILSLLPESISSPSVNSMPVKSTSIVPAILQALSLREKTAFTSRVRHYLARKFTTYTYTYEDDAWSATDAARVGGAAQVLVQLAGIDIAFHDSVVGMIQNISTIPATIGLQRVFVLVQRELISSGTSNLTDESLATVFRRGVTSWGDSIYIKYTPVSAQQDLCTYLLLLAAYIPRAQLVDLSRESVYLQAITNRIGSSSERARVLGMIIGEAVSTITETKPDMRLRFRIPDLDTTEALWLKSMIRVHDTLAPLRDLDAGLVVERAEDERPTDMRETTNEALSVEEVLPTGLESDEVDDLQPYAIPDSDDEDDDPDPELVTREKITPPLYILDLIAQLRDTESYARHRCGLLNAASLIRRKQAFGTEVSDHAITLTRMLTSLNNTFGLDEFEPLRQDALTALVVASPVSVGNFLALNFFEGDYSLSQRLQMLGAISVGAYELATSTPPAALAGLLLPLAKSKQLSIRAQGFYSSDTVEAVTRSLESAVLAPITQRAVDALAGPKALQVNRFSSRPAVEARRAKPLTNRLAKIAHSAFFFPLTGQFWTRMQDYSGRGPHFEPLLLSTFIRTLGIILRCSAPSSPALRPMTAELWPLLLALHGPVLADDLSVLEAIMFTMLIILETHIDEARYLAETYGKELAHTQRWAEAVFERCGNEHVRVVGVGIGAGVGGADKESEENRVKMLAGAVLMRIGDVVEKHARLLYWHTSG